MQKSKQIKKIGKMWIYKNKQNNKKINNEKAKEQTCRNYSKITKEEKE